MQFKVESREGELVSLGLNFCRFPNTGIKSLVEPGKKGRRKYFSSVNVLSLLDMMKNTQSNHCVEEMLVS